MSTTRLDVSPTTIGGVEPGPQTNIAMLAKIVLTHIETRVPAVVARFQKRAATTGTKMAPDRNVYAISRARMTFPTTSAMASTTSPRAPVKPREIERKRAPISLP